MKNIFIVPTHRPHFGYAYRLLDSFSEKNLNSDLMFVLSDEKEFNEFKEGKSKKCYLPSDISRGQNSRGIITIKKFYGLKLAIDIGYEYGITLDSECIFTKDCDAYQIAKYLSQRKIVFSTKNNKLTNINQISANVFTIDEQNKLRDLTSNFREYFWFNDLPFYDLQIYNKFIHRMCHNDCNQFYSKISWPHFDHIVFIYFCLLNYDYQIVNLNSTIDLPELPYANFYMSILESIGHKDSRSIISKEIADKILNYIKPFWLPHNSVTTSDNSFITFHLNR